jgi:copper chaperone CopZ
MIKKTFKIPDMTCTNCAMKLESLEDILEGVKEINASCQRSMKIRLSPLPRKRDIKLCLYEAGVHNKFFGDYFSPVIR